MTVRTEKILKQVCGWTFVVAAVALACTDEWIAAGSCMVTSSVIFSLWTPGADREIPGDPADNPTPQQVRQYRKDNPGTSIPQAVGILREKKSEG